MNMEQMSGNENEKVELGNQMQAMLAERHGEQMVDFIDNHAEEFRKYVDDNTTILDEFKHDPEGAIKIIEPILYQ